MTKTKPMCCSLCQRPHRRKGQRHCGDCHAKYQRRYRAKLKAERLAVARFLQRAQRMRGEQERAAA